MRLYAYIDMGTNNDAITRFPAKKWFMLGTGNRMDKSLVRAGEGLGYM